jgi:hypothetical protein
MFKEIINCQKTIGLCDIKEGYSEESIIDGLSKNGPFKKSEILGTITCNGETIAKYIVVNCNMDCKYERI